VIGLQKKLQDAEREAALADQTIARTINA